MTTAAFTISWRASIARLATVKDAITAMEQMKAIQQSRRAGAVIAFKDSHPSTLDDEP
jgi:hypothetical protein